MNHGGGGGVVLMYVVVTPIFLLFHHQFASGEALPEQQAINVWPKPRFLEWSSPQRSILLSRSFTIISPPRHPHLSPAVRRYLHLILSERYHPPVAVLSSFPSTTTTTTTTSDSLLHRLVVVISGDLHAPLQHGVDESYNLTIPPPSSETATLRAETVWGAMRGLETFSQLVYGDPPRAPSGVEVRDWPMFEHRGVLLDTSRNFYSVEDILRTIEAMSANKLNVFHWHISDSQSFPLVLPSEPRLAAEGSYGAEMQYTPEDVGRIVRFGMEHGVRVMPEIDAPGHTGSWAGAYPEIVSCAGKFWWPAGSEWAERMASEPGSGQLNPVNPDTYRVYANIINDVSSLFPEHLFHAGGDEVVPGCWKSDPAIQSYLASNKGATLSDLLEKFVNCTLPLIINNKKKKNRTGTSSTAVYWEDVLLDNNVRVRDTALLPAERTIMQSWNGGPDNTLRLVKLGYRTIVSSSDYYYLDCGHGGFVGNDSGYDRAGDHRGNGGSWCSPFKTWQRIYDYDVVPADITSEDERSLVIGGEVALWSEQSDGTVLDGRLWPRASAFAESMWSGNRDEKTGQKRYAEATHRLGLWRHRMVVGRRAVAAEPIQPLWCLRNPGMCNTQNSS